jgi:alpha-tubulin suppressor-like RCC1 family protein
MLNVRSIAMVLVCLVVGCGGGSEETDGLPAELRLSIQPGTVVAPHNQSVTVRVDMPSVPDRDLPAGYAIDLDEVVGRIDVAAAPCPAGAGSRMCQDWTITPASQAVPGHYDVNVRTVGSRAGTAAGAFRLVVVSAPAPALGAAVALAYKSGHLLVLDETGRVFARGENHHAEVRSAYRRQPFPGDDPLSVIEPLLVDEFVETKLPPARWTGVAVSASASFALRDDGTLWAWGANYDDDLGLGSSARDENIVEEPLQVPALANVRALSPGYTGEARLVPVVLLADGRARRWHRLSGLMPYCEIVSAGGDCERELTSVVAITGAAQDAVFLKNDGSVWRAPYRPCEAGDCPADRDRYVDGPGRVERMTGALPPAVAIGSGLAYGVAVTADGAVWQWSRDGSPDSAAPEPGLTDVIALAGSYHGYPLALKRDGTVWVWSPGRAPARQVAGLANVVVVGDSHAITADCGSVGGAVWRIDGATATAHRLEGFGRGASCNAPPTRTITVAIEGSGRVVSAPAGIDCPGVCSAPFALDAQVFLNEAPARGWTTALRPARSEELNARRSGDQPDWRGDAACAHAIVVRADMNCQIRFVPGGDRRLVVSVIGAGRVTSSPPGIDCGDDCVQAFAVDTQVQLRAAPGLGYRFSDFAGDGDCADGQLVLDAVRDCVARFVALPAPAAPTGFVATAQGVQVQLRWDAVNGPVVSYQLERADASGNFATLTSAIAGTASSFIDGSAAASTTYTYRLTALNIGGASAAVTAVVTTGVTPPLPPRGWVELGVALSATSDGPQATEIALDSNGVPTVAYVESISGIGRLFVKRFDGSVWQALGGGALNPSSSTGASDPSLILGPDGQPMVAFSQGNGQQQNIFVVRFDGNAWQSLGPPGQPLNFAAGSIAVGPSLAISAFSAPTVAWIENGAVRAKRFIGEFGVWEAFGSAGPESANVDAVQLAIDPTSAPVIVWRETSNGMRELRAARGFGLQSIGLVAGPLPSSQIRDFGVVVETQVDPLGEPLVVFAQGTSPWSLRTRRFEAANWLVLPDAVTDAVPSLQAMALHRGHVNQGVAVTYQTASGSELVVYRRMQAGWAAASTALALGSAPQLALAMAAPAAPVVAVVEHEAGVYRLRVFRYFP